MTPVTTESPSAPSSEIREFTILQQRTTKINWDFAIALLIFHAGAVAALFHFTWGALAAFFVLWFLCQNIGIAVCYHRLLTHRGFVVPKWLEYTFAVFSTMALQGGPLYWVALHRLHHQLSDRPGDPHSPRDGYWWSHVDWIIHGSLHNGSELLNRYAPDLAKDPFYRWLSRYHWLPVTISGVVLLLIGGLPWLLWGVFMRVTLGLHVTWLVNSATHIWGKKRFATRDDSKNNWWVALLSGGEGWHNNHHAHPTSARHGLAWYELDINYLFIRLLVLLRLATKVRVTQI